MKVADDAIKGKVQTSLKSDANLEDVKVASVNDGVVLLSGKTKTLDQKLRAVETAWAVNGVKRVATEIETGDVCVLRLQPGRGGPVPGGPCCRARRRATVLGERHPE